jgi:glycosyltransferase involved in cell wall biosynthesis
MKILLINHYAGSNQLGMEYRPFYLGQEWVRSGHAVTIVAASFSHSRTVQPAVTHSFQVTEEGGVRFIWIKSNRYVGNGAARIANILRFVGTLLANVDRIVREEQPEIVICSSTYPLDIYPGLRMARRAGAHLVFEVHDLWPLSPMLLGGYSPRHPFIKFLQRAEDKAYDQADLVVSILPNALPYMLSRGMQGHKFVHIPNGVVVDSAPLATDDNLEIHSKIREIKQDGNFSVGYAGSIGIANCVHTLVDAAALLKDVSVSFFVIGDGPQLQAIRERASLAQANIHFNSRVSKQSFISILARMDLLYFGLPAQPLYRFGISPNKLFEYMLAGKPIVQAVDAANDLVSQANCGITVPPEDPHAIADAILRLRDMSAEDRDRLGSSGRRFVMRKHDYRILARDFLQQMTEIRVGAAALEERTPA